ncbi:MAG TPA: hypothetical protein VEQ11_18675 [Chloroflexota bacterium]|nr:hypothetical protein [Chloroflexota bacterium]
MQNPWKRAPRSAPFLLEEDRPLVEAFNRRARPDYAVHTELTPEPFLGRPDAPVVLLNLNPSWVEGDLGGHDRPDFALAARDNLLHVPSDYPFFLLAPRFEATGGGQWWRARLRWPIEDVGLAAVAQGLFVAEFFPYHSTKGYHGPRLPSQGYSFHLVERAMDRNALILLLRSERLWFNTIPSLRSYGRLYRLRSVQGVWISPANCPQGYSPLLRGLAGAAAGAG